MNAPFQLSVSGGMNVVLDGYNHIALVCRDMARTVDFYTNVLGMPLLKTLDLGGGFGQHFFFDCGAGDCVAFFWFPKAPAAAPGIAAASPDFAAHGFRSAHGSLNYLALSVAPADFDTMAARLRDHGVAVDLVTPQNGVSATSMDGRALFFFDPDGIRIEIAERAEALSSAAPVLPRNAGGERIAITAGAHTARNPIAYGGEGAGA